MPAACVDEYKKRFGELNTSLATSLSANLERAYEKIQFPFEDSVNYKALALQLDSIVSILRVLREIYYQLERDEKFVCLVLFQVYHL